MTFWYHIYIMSMKIKKKYLNRSTRILRAKLHLFFWPRCFITYLIFINIYKFSLSGLRAYEFRQTKYDTRSRKPKSGICYLGYIRYEILNIFKWCKTIYTQQMIWQVHICSLHFSITHSMIEVIDCPIFIFLSLLRSLIFQCNNYHFRTWFMIFLSTINVWWQKTTYLLHIYCTWNRKSSIFHF